MRGGRLSEPGPRSGKVWRLVEAQHRVSTLKLVDDADEQATLEALIDATKPPVPPECRHLHYLLFTPFRYGARGDSRFRRAGATPGVFYAAEAVATAVAEIAFWRLLFFLESPALPWPANPLEFTAFRAAFAAERCLDLTAPPYDAREAEWRHPTDCAPCHAIADAARARGCGAIRSRSARDPAEGINISLLTCAAFAHDIPLGRETWRLRLSASGAMAIQDRRDGARLDFGRGAFARDPRVHGAVWDRG